MIGTGKCQKCEQVVHQVKFEGVDANQNFGLNGLKALNFICPNCSTILGVQIDPIAVKADTIKELKKLLGRP